MLKMFKDETEYGKLYINYPMIESIRYTKTLPDKEFYKYVITREDCRNFKKLAADFSSYSSLDFILLDPRKELPERKKNSLKRNWDYIKEQNVNKANYICHGNNDIPTRKEEVAQNLIFKSQLLKYVNKDQSEVAILNAFPLFLYEYFK